MRYQLFYTVFCSVSVSVPPALPLSIGRLWQCERCLSVFVGCWWTRPVIVASWLDHDRSLQHHLLASLPRELRCISAGVAVVGHFCSSEELPPCTCRAVPSSCGSPRLRDGRVVPQTTQNVDGAQQGQGGTFPVPYLDFKISEETQLCDPFLEGFKKFRLD